MRAVSYTHLDVYKRQLFLLATIFSPLFLTIPSFATAPALIIVGFYMMGSALSLIHISSGAKIYFGSMQYTKDRTNYQGKAFDFIGFDELTHFEWEEYRCV